VHLHARPVPVGAESATPTIDHSDASENSNCS
jgi:hypothetical protein